MQETLDQDREALLEALRELGIPNVWEQTVPAGVELPIVNGVHLPYVLVSFGGLSPVAQPMQGIVGSREDLKWTSVAIESVGASPKDARTVEGLARDYLEGREPAPGWGQLREQLSDSYTVKIPDYEMWPVRFVRAAVFNAQVGA